MSAILPDVVAGPTDLQDNPDKPISVFCAYTLIDSRNREQAA
jgi:hypothetical protein